MTKPNLEVFFKTIYLICDFTSIDLMFFVVFGTRSVDQIAHLKPSLLYHSILFIKHLPHISQ